MFSGDTQALKRLMIGLAATALLVACPAHAEQWDIPMAYADSNYHTQNDRAFAEAVRVATDCKLEIDIHSDGSLFKGNEIRRAVQTRQAPIGERLLFAHQIENAVFGFDSVPSMTARSGSNSRTSTKSMPVAAQLCVREQGRLERIG